MIVRPGAQQASISALRGSGQGIGGWPGSAPQRPADQARSWLASQHHRPFGLLKDLTFPADPPYRSCCEPVRCPVPRKTPGAWRGCWQLMSAYIRGLLS